MLRVTVTVIIPCYKTRQKRRHGRRLDKAEYKTRQQTRQGRRHRIRHDKAEDKTRLRQNKTETRRD